MNRLDVLVYSMMALGRNEMSVVGSLMAKLRVVLLSSILLLGLSSNALAQTFEEFYVPLPEGQAFEFFDDIDAPTGGVGLTPVLPVITRTDIVIRELGTVVIFDPSADGFEADTTYAVGPFAATTAFWGDSDCSNGFNPNLANCTNDVDDVFDVGEVVVFDQADVVARDFFRVNRTVNITRSLFPTGTGTFLAGAFELFPAAQFGNNYILPIGENTANSNDMFEQVAITIMASEDNTSVIFDPDGNGAAPAFAPVLLNRGESIEFGIGDDATLGRDLVISEGATINSGAPVQVNVLTGDVNSTYEVRFYTLFPNALLSNTYYEAVGTTDAADDAVVFLFNPTDADIVVDAFTNASPNAAPTAVTVTANASARFEVPPANANGLTGIRFESQGGEVFTAYTVIDDGNQIHDWGHVTTPLRLLGDTIRVGFAPGNNPELDNAIDPLNASPIWVIADVPGQGATQDIEICVDAGGNGGPLTDAVSGNTFDYSVIVQPLDSTRLYSQGVVQANNGLDQTGMLAFACNSVGDIAIADPAVVLLAAAWGQDPEFTAPGDSGFDVGTTIRTGSNDRLFLGDEIFEDLNGNGARDAGEPLIAGVDVTISVANLDIDVDRDTPGIQNTLTIRTTSNGYLFTGLTSGQNYTITVTPPDSFSPVSDPDGVLDNTTTVNLSASTLAQDFGYVNGVPIGLVGDFIYTDINGNGIQDAAEPGIGGINLELCRIDGGTFGTIIVATDEYDTVAYNNNAAQWASDWIELNDDGSPATTQPGNDGIFITGAGELSISGNNGSPSPSLTRQIDLTGFGDVALTFGFRGADDTYEPADQIFVELSIDGGAFTNLTTILGADIDDFSGNITLPFDSQGSNNVRVRFQVAPGASFNTAGEVLFIDNLAIVDNPVCQTEVTDSAGGYLFTDVPTGEYEITVLNPPAGLQNTDDPSSDGNSSNTFNLLNSGGNLEQDFGYFDPSFVIGRVYLDTNGNGVQDVNEPGIANLDIVVTDSLGNFQIVETDANGDYLAQVPPGVTQVNIDDNDPQFPSGFIQTDGVDPTNVLAVAGVTADAGDDGYFQGNTIGDTIYSEEFATSGLGTLGAQDGGDPGIPNVLVTLTPPINVDLGLGAGVAISQLTDVNGNYSFVGLPDANYVVTVTQPSGSTQTQDPDGGNDNSSAVSISGGIINNDQDFGYANNVATGRIGDRVYNDINGNGVQDPGEPGLAGITVQISGDLDDDDNTVNTVRTEVTDANGDYLFGDLLEADGVTADASDTGLPTTNGAEVYTVTILTPPAGQINSQDPDGGLPNFSQLTLSTAGGNLDQDFGYFVASVVTGHLYIDSNGNGNQDAGEPDLAGVDVIITDANGNQQTVSSDINGDYSASVPPGATTANVDETDAQFPLNHLQTEGTDPTTVTAVAGATVSLGIDGYAPMGFIGDKVFFDSATQGSIGVFDSAFDTGISAVAVTLTPPAGIDLGNGAGVPLTTVTDANGNYGFGALPAGTYLINVTPPSNVTPSVDPNELGVCVVCDSASTITIVAGEINAIQDFGYQSLEPSGRIGDRVFNDLNGNGVQEPNEPGLANIDVQLCGDLDDNDATVETCRVETTDADGDYLFGDGLAADGVTANALDIGLPATTGTEDYTLRVLNPPVGSTNTADPDGLTASVAQLTLPGGFSNLDQDFGYVIRSSLSGTVWLDEDLDGILDIEETGITGVQVELILGGAVVATTVADANGNYSFADILPGEYTVNVIDTTLPPGLQNTAGANGVDPRLVSVESGVAVDNIDFGYIPNTNTGAIGDRVWFDANSNGIQDPGEAGIGGVTLNLTNSDGSAVAGVGSVTSNENGDYLFTNVPFGDDYIASIATGDPQLSGFAPTVGPQSEGGFIGNPVSLSATASVVTDIDFGFNAANSNTIIDSFWVDSDRDGIRDTDEEPLANVTATLFNDANNDGIADDADGNGQPDVVATTRSDLNGEIRFTGLQDGSYVIAVTDVNNELLTYLGTTTEAAASLSETVSVSSGATNSQNSFGYNQAGLIAGTVYADTDVSFDQDPGEAGFSDVTVTLLLDADGNGTFETTVETVQTGADGLYEFNVNNPGDYRVVVTPPGGTQTEDPEGTPNNQTDITLTTGQSSVGNDFGYEGVANTFDLSGTVFLDSDKDGVEDIGEIGIQGVTLALISRSTIDSYNVINGMLDINDDGVINSDDDGQADGIAIVDGNFDINGNGSIGEDDSAAVEGFDILAGMINLAQAGVASQSSTLGSFVASNAINGITSSNANSELAHTSGGGATNQWWELDLGSVQAIGEITIFNRDNCCQNRLTGVAVMIADTPFDAPAALGENAASLTAANANQDARIDLVAPNFAAPIAGDVVVDFAGVQARYIRLQKTVTTGGSAINILEVKVTPNFIPRTTVDADRIVATTTSDVNGNYVFSGLPNGDYSVAVTDTAVRLAGFDITSGLDVLDRAIADADEVNVDFGYIREEATASISGEVFIDENTNANAEDGEFNLSNVDVHLCRAPLDTGVSLPNGVVSFARYDGAFNVVADIEVTGALSTGPDETRSDFGILAADNNTNQFAYIFNGFINITTAGSYRFRTLSDDGSVVVVDGSLVVDNDGGHAAVTVTSDPITLSAGFHSIEVRYFEQAGGDTFVFTYETPGGGGFTALPPAILSSLSDMCNPSHPNFVASTTSDANGEYIFRDLPPGQYVVDSDPSDIPAGLEKTVDPEVVNLSERENVTDVDHGYSSSDIPGDPDGNSAGVLSGFVWVDVDANGNFDANESPISGVTINVFRASSAPGSPPVLTTTTEPDGSWIISNIVANLADDLIVTYQANDVTDGGVTISGIDSAAGANLNQTQPTNLPIGDDIYNPVPLLSDDDNIISNLNFGFDPGTTDLGSIRGTIYTDADQNGDLGLVSPSVDTELRDVTVNLLDEAGNVLATTRTDENGQYMFVGLNVGDSVTGLNYQVVITDNINVTSDLNPLETLPTLINLRDVAGTSSNPTAGVRNAIQQDAGFISDTDFFSIGNRFFFDANRNGIVDDDESGIEGVTVQCWLDVDQSETPNDPSVGSSSVVPQPGIDNLIRTVVTDENGEYVCTSLPNGNYIVVVADANGFDELADGTLVTGSVGDNFAKNWSYALTLGIDDPATAVDESSQPNFAADFGVSGSNTLSGLIFVEPENLIEPADGAVVIDPNVNLDGVAGGPSDDSSTNGVDLAATVNVPVDLLLEQQDGSFQVIQTTTSGADGSYNFEGLPDGRYQVRVRPTGTGIDGYGQTGDPDLALIAGGDPTDLVCDSVTISLCDNTAGTPIDLDSAGANTAGITESGVDFGYQRGFATTPVTINFFSSTRSGGTVNFVWETSNEVGHAGFQVYARTQEGWQLLNDQLLVGNIDVNSEVETKQYNFEAQSEAKWFALVDVSDTEEVIARGPFKVGEEYGANLGKKDVFDWSLVVPAAPKSVDEVRTLIGDKLGQRASESDEFDPEFEAFLDEVDQLDGEAL